MYGGPPNAATRRQPSARTAASFWPLRSRPCSPNVLGVVRVSSIVTLLFSEALPPMRSLPFPRLLRRGRLVAIAGAALMATVGTTGCSSAQTVSTVSVGAHRDSVNVGYGLQARRDLTGSVGSVTGEVAQRSTPTSMADMIDGRFAGVEVRRLASGGMSVRIRGSRSFKGDGEPLFVVDGIPQHGNVNGALSDIDPRDVQSIEVLKDAGSTAVYGARGANGVILITTKRPQ
jgi:TonB-dependent SusC/RagA subfamily outer membrane receptor